jgi:hypothetical protein
MPAIITSKYRLYNARQFIESVSETTDKNNLYLFIGRSTVWPNELVPPTITDSPALDFDTWKSMIAMKRLISADMILATTKRNWQTGTIYDEYRHNYSPSNPSYSGATNLYNASFFVITDAFQVYKCISNNNNGISTVKPEGTSTSIFGTADGYFWKYMYTVSSGNQAKFSSSGFIPVEANSTVSAAAIDGAIHTVRIINGGSGYVSAPSVTITGDGVNASASATVTGGVVTAITMTNIGSGYRNATVSFSTGSATAEAIISPYGGHGADNFDELGAYRVIMNSKLEYDEEGKFPISNDYRNIGIISDPYNFGTTTVATNTVLNAMAGLDFSSVSGNFVVDELITGQTTGATARVVSWDSSTSELRFVKSSNENNIAFQVGEIVIGGTSGVGGTVSALLNSDVVKYSGDIIYNETRTAISRATDQIDSITLVVQF